MSQINSDLKKTVDRWRAKAQLARAALNYSNLNSRIAMEVFLLNNREEMIPGLSQTGERLPGTPSFFRTSVNSLQGSLPRCPPRVESAARGIVISLS
jgi:hypothetical protein